MIAFRKRAKRPVGERVALLMYLGALADYILFRFRPILSPLLYTIISKSG